MKLKTIIIGFIIAFISSMAGAYLCLINISSPPPAPSPDPGEKKPQPLVAIKGSYTILLMGEDNVETSRRSDTVALITLDIDQQIIRILSLPRDTRVDIPGYGFQKLNHAYAYGKQDLLRATVERMMNIAINYYIKIDYDSFPALVDLVGGVDLYVPKTLKYTDKRGGLYINIPAGQQHLDGAQALHFVRFRHDALGDIGRIQRQQQFLKALIYKMFEPKNICRFPLLMPQISNAIQSDIPASLMLQLGYFLRELEKERGRIFFSMLPGKPAMFSNLSYWVPDVSEGVNFLSSDYDTLRSRDLSERVRGNNQVPSISTAENGSLNSPTSPEISSSETSRPTPFSVMQIVEKMPEPVAVLNGTGRSGRSKLVAEHLQRIGIDVIYTGNAKHNDYRATNIIFPINSSPKSVEAAKLLGELCGIPVGLIRVNKLATYPSLIVGRDDYEKLIKRLEDSYASQ